MRYSLFAGGKRMRLILCLAAAEACGGKIADALPLACAVECIHTYSLIHDDLPSMDNDDFRRGRAPWHRVFGDGIAVLAGDALLTIAFEIAAQADCWPRYDMREIIREVAVAAGSRKLIAGQVADLEGEGKPHTRAQLRYIHENKTAALLTTSVRLGAMSANAPPTPLSAISDFGRAPGLAFPVIGDLLDVTQPSGALSQGPGQAGAPQHATYPAGTVLGNARARRARGAEAGAPRLCGRVVDDACQPGKQRVRARRMVAPSLTRQERGHLHEAGTPARVPVLASGQDGYEFRHLDS